MGAGVFPRISCYALFCPLPIPQIQYLVSYTVVHDQQRYRKHYVSGTNDLAKVLRHLLGRRGILKKHLRDYKRDHYTYLDTQPERAITEIQIRELPEQHERILALYLWGPTTTDALT